MRVKPVTQVRCRQQVVFTPRCKRLSTGGSLTLGVPVGTSVCPLLVGLLSGEFFGERSGVVISPERDHSEQNQPVSTILDTDLAVLPQTTTVVEALHPSMVEVRDRVSWPLGPCSKVLVVGILIGRGI